MDSDPGFWINGQDKQKQKQTTTNKQTENLASQGGKSIVQPREKLKEGDRKCGGIVENDEYCLYHLKKKNSIFIFF